MKPEEEKWRNLVRLFKEVQTEELMDGLLHLFLTINEREFLVDRYQIIKSLLATNLTQREMAAKLNVSIAKITAGSNELKRTDEALKEYIIKFIEKHEAPLN